MSQDYAAMKRHNALQDWFQKMAPAFVMRMAMTHFWFQQYISQYFPVALFYYEDMMDDLASHVQRVAEFLELPPLSARTVSQIVSDAQPDNMKKMEQQRDPSFPGRIKGAEHPKVKASEAEEKKKRKRKKERKKERKEERKKARRKKK